MCVLIFILKLTEYLLYREIANGYPSINANIANFDCMLGASYSLLIFIIIYLYFRNKIRSKNKMLCLSILLIIFTIILSLLVITTFMYVFPLNLRISRCIGLLLSVVTCIFVIRKSKQVA